MGIKSVLKRSFGAGLSPKRWLGFDQIKSNSRTITGIMKSIFSTSKEEGKRKETFEEAVKRLGLTEEDIQKRMKSAKELVFIFLIFTVLLFVYSLYQWIIGRFIPGFTCLILSSLTLAYAFREHFNLFQMHHRRLGCTYKEWLNSTFKGSK